MSMTAPGEGRYRVFEFEGRDGSRRRISAADIGEAVNILAGEPATPRGPFRFIGEMPAKTAREAAKEHRFRVALLAQIREKAAQADNPPHMVELYERTILKLEREIAEGVQS